MKATASRIPAICAIAVCISRPSAVCQNPYYGSVPDVLSLVNVGGNIQMAQFARLDFAQTILRLIGGGSRIVHRPLPVDDPKVRQPDIRLARQLLDWEPTMDLERGLRTTIEYFRGKV